MCDWREKLRHAIVLHVDASWADVVVCKHNNNAAEVCGCSKLRQKIAKRVQKAGTEY